MYRLALIHNILYFTHTHALLRGRTLVATCKKLLLLLFLSGVVRKIKPGPVCGRMVCSAFPCVLWIEIIWKRNYTNIRIRICYFFFFSEKNIFQPIQRQFFFLGRLWTIVSPEIDMGKEFTIQNVERKIPFPKNVRGKTLWICLRCCWWRCCRWSQLSMEPAGWVAAVAAANGFIACSRKVLAQSARVPAAAPPRDRHASSGGWARAGRWIAAWPPSSGSDQLTLLIHACPSDDGVSLQRSNNFFFFF